MSSNNEKILLSSPTLKDGMHFISLYCLGQSSPFEFASGAELGSWSISLTWYQSQTPPILVSPDIVSPYYLVHAPVGILKHVMA